MGPEIPGGSLESKHRESLDSKPGLRALGGLVQEREVWGGPIILDLPTGSATGSGEW